MSMWNRIAAYAKRRAAFPVSGVRISEDEPSSLTERLTEYLGDFSGIAAKYPFELLEALDAIFMLEPYQARYLHTTLALGNTGHKLQISAATEAQAREAIDCANNFAARCFPLSGGMDGAINGFFCQTARTGGLCGEAPPDRAVTQVERIYLVPVRTCRFRKDPDGNLELCQRQREKLVPLNPVQTVWHVAVPWDGNPYPMPPALGALKALARLKRFDDSLDAWLKKLSALGVFLASADPPPQEAGESQAVYEAKAQGYLRRLAQSLRDNLKQGFAAAFKNVELKFQNTSAGAGGAKELYQIILQGMFAGLQRDPVFFGHNFNTTETFATVVFEELLGGILNFQRGVKRAVEHFHRLNFALSGLGNVGSSVIFNPNRSLDAFMHNEAQQMFSAKIQGELNAGIIDVDEARRLLGYTDMPAQSDAFVAAFNRSDNVYRLDDYRRRKWAGMDLADAAGRGRQCPYANARIEMANGVREARQAARQYVFNIQSQLSDAAAIGVKAVYEWAKVRDIPEEDEFVAEALRLFLSGAEKTLDATTLEKIGKEHLSKIWQWARYEDATLFGADWDRQTGGIGTILGGEDNAAIRYMSRVDRFYVSTYVSGDERTSAQIQNFLREQYLEKGLGIGKRAKDLAAFRDQFSELAERIGEHRSRVIIDTGVSRAQNWGECLALHDEQIVKFRIAGPWDRLTCDWCNAVRGKEFEVRKDVERIQDIISSGDEDISKFGQFMTARWGGATGADALTAATAEDIQAGGMACAPLHPLCRHRMVAVIEQAARNARIYEYEPPVLIAYALAA